MGQRRGPLAPESARPVTRSQTQPRRSHRHAQQQRATSRGQSRARLLGPITRHQTQTSQAQPHQPERISAVASNPQPEEAEEHLSGRNKDATSSAVAADTSTSFLPAPQELLNNSVVPQSSALIPFSPSSASSIQDHVRAISSLTHSMDRLYLDGTRPTDAVVLSQQVSHVRVEYSNLIRKVELEPLVVVPQQHHYQDQNQQLLITAIAGLHRRFDRIEALLLSHGGNF